MFKLCYLCECKCLKNKIYMSKEKDKLQEQTAENKQKEVDAVEQKPKKTNRTWEAFGKSKGCFIINDPKFLL